MSIYSTLIIKNLGGFSEAEAILLSIPYNIISIILIFMTIYFNNRFREYGYIATICCVITLIGLLLLISLPKGHPIIIGLFLANIGPQYSIITTLISVNTSGYTKKTFYTSMGVVSRCLGDFVGPLLMNENQFPRYTNAMITFIITTCISALLFLYIRKSYVRDNRYRRIQLSFKANRYVKKYINITDKENLHFVYHP
ncbi:hypothetical protein INT45_007181 [Circinella minor]|uniref:Uncharacterized protein n=1 Tax=Circinella minor TaxID=1195481 RepID=A0A8H7S234_9FUNG|nr:hypothetical protein INT45_007181 [Circinella minor]